MPFVLTIDGMKQISMQKHNLHMSTNGMENVASHPVSTLTYNSQQGMGKNCYHRTHAERVKGTWSTNQFKKIAETKLSYNNKERQVTREKKAKTFQCWVFICLFLPISEVKSLEQTLHTKRRPWCLFMCSL